MSAFASTRMLVVRRAAVALALTIGWLMLLAQPASAHTVSGVGATNWASFITSISPKVPGLTIRLVEDGSRLEVINTGPEITIIGYEGEAYLRVGPEGVFENLESPATYLNCSRTGCAIPGGLDINGPPKWKKISSGDIARYHDHRTHWMGSSPPPNVAQAPNKVHIEATWTVTMKQGPTAITVMGNYTWIPGSSPFPWLAAGLVLFAVGASLGFFGGWGAPLAAAVVVVTLNDLFHALDIAWFWSGNFTYRFEKFFSGSFYSMVGWVLGIVAAWLLIRRRIDGLYAAVFAGGSAALFTGLLDFTVLSRSQAPFTASIFVDRVTVIISLGLGLGVAVGALLAIRAAKPMLEGVEYDDFDENDDFETDEVDMATGAGAADSAVPVAEEATSPVALLVRAPGSTTQDPAAPTQDPEPGDNADATGSAASGGSETASPEHPATT